MSKEAKACEREKNLHQSFLDTIWMVTEWADPLLKPFCGELERAGIRVETDRKKILTALEACGGHLPEGILVVSDGQLEKLGGKVPECGLLSYRRQGQEMPWGGQVFLGADLPDPEELTPEYLERVYRRQRGSPWDLLETDRCLLRETCLEDLDAFYEIYAEPSVTEFMEPLFEDRAKEEAYVESYRENIYEFYGFGIWTVVEKETGRIIGRAGISMREGFDVPEIGFVIGVPWQGKGYAYEVCRACLDYAFGELGFEEVIALVQPGNAPSEGLCRKLGMREAGETVAEDGVKYRKYSVSV